MVRSTLLGEHTTASTCLKGADAAACVGVRDTSLLNGAHGPIPELTHLLRALRIDLKRGTGRCLRISDGGLHQTTSASACILHAGGHDLLSVRGCDRYALGAALLRRDPRLIALQGWRLIPVELVAGRCFAGGVRLTLRGCQVR